MVEPRVESTEGRGHEELYVVVTSAARSTVGGDDVNAGVGTLVFVQPAAHRAAVAKQGA